MRFGEGERLQGGNVRRRCRRPGADLVEDDLRAAAVAPRVRDQHTVVCGSAVCAVSASFA